MTLYELNQPSEIHCSQSLPVSGFPKVWTHGNRQSIHRWNLKHSMAAFVRTGRVE